MKIAVLIAVIYLISTIVLQAQSVVGDSISIIKEVVINGNRIENFTAGTLVQESDSQTKQHFRFNNLYSYLAQNSSGYFKSYGQGSLSTLSLRGASASQTSVLWNGFNLQSPMNGILDFALIPMVLTDRIRLQFGGCGALWGSGAISGSIHLDNKQEYNKGLSVVYNGNMASYSSTNHSASISYSKKKWITSAKGFYSEAQNNFQYINSTKLDNPKEIQSNAALVQYGYMLDNYIKLSKKSQWNIRIWQQNSTREIPPTMTMRFSDAKQMDWFTRISTEWQHTGTKLVWNVRGAYFDEKLRYIQNSNAIDAYSNSICQITEAETKFNIQKSLILNIGINNTYCNAKVDNYIGIPFQNRSAIFSSLKYSNKKKSFLVNAGARKEIIVGTLYSSAKEIPIMPFVGTDIKIIRNVVLKSVVSRNYRLPTFNDLYWTPGGNSLLQPEQGWSEEAGLHYTVFGKKCKGDSCSFSDKQITGIRISSTFFNRVIDNWIMWIPKNNGYWTAENILKVWSRGLETKIDSKFKLNNIYYNIGLSYDYVVSTNEKVAQGNEQELGKQLIYVPLHKGAIIMDIKYKNYDLGFNYLYTGWVFTQADNENFINDYWMGNIFLSKHIPLSKHSMTFILKVNNIFNKDYQIIAYRAMPGRNYELGLSFQLNQK